MNQPPVPKNDVSGFSDKLVGLDLPHDNTYVISKLFHRRPVGFVLVRMMHDSMTSWINSESSVSRGNIIQIRAHIQLLANLIGMRSKFFSIRFAWEVGVDASGTAASP